MESMLERAATGKSERNLARLWASTSHELEIDRQGRMAIPAAAPGVRRPGRRRAGARSDRPGRAVESRVLGPEGPARGGATHPRRRRLSAAMRLHVVRHHVEQPSGSRKTPGRATHLGTVGTIGDRVSPDHPSIDRHSDPILEAGTSATIHTIGSDAVGPPTPASGSAPPPNRPKGPRGDSSPRRRPSRRRHCSGARTAGADRRPMSRAWPQWPVTRCTSNVSGPCAVPRPDPWKNPPPPTSREIVAVLHPQASCRSRDCG